MKPFTKLAALIFGIVCAGHIVRLTQGWKVTVHTVEVPLWLSNGGAAATGLLAILLLWESRRTDRT